MGGMLQFILESNKLSSLNTMWSVLQLDNASRGVKIEFKINMNKEVLWKGISGRGKAYTRPKGKSEQESWLDGV